MITFETAPTLPPWLDRLLPFERHVYRLQKGEDAGKRIHFLAQGTGSQPVVLLHGNPTWSFLWRKVITALMEDGGAARYRCLAPDLLGLGLSDRLPSLKSHSIARHAEAITEWMEALGLQNPILVCQDWGGPILTAAGRRFAERGNSIAGIVILNTAVVVPDHPRNTPFHRFANRPLISDFVFRVLGFPVKLPMSTLHKVQGDPASIRGEVAKAYRWPIGRERGWHDRGIALALARMVPNHPAHPSMAELKATEAWLRSYDGPIAFVWGERDPVLGRALKRHTEAFPDAPVTRTEAGHFLQEEVPEEIAAAVRGLTPNPSPKGRGAFGD
jgi:haloalkane dehalogenase